jgi:hypothetical protein
MAININGNIISSSDITSVGVFKTEVNRDGLICYLDAANKYSYPGSGTVWYDLSGNGNNGTLTTMNSPSAGNTSGFDTTTGYMMFDRHVGSTDGTANNYIAIANSTTIADCASQNGMTMEMWFKETSTVCTALTKFLGSWEIYLCANLVHRTDGTGGNAGDSGVGSSVGTWRYIVATHNGINRRLYLNGTYILNDINVVSAQTTSNNLAVGAYYGGNYSCVGAIPIYRLYTRELSPYEIAENFQAEKGRFGL